MSRTFLILLAIAALTAAVSFGLARRLRSTDGHHDLRRELNLTPDQAAQYDKLVVAYRNKFNDCCAAHCEARAELAQALNQSPVNTNATSACCDRMCAAQTKSEKATLDHILKVRALLTPDQQRRYAAILREQLTATCPMRQP
jgi:Spy/CpxP family protein refolding chaperone